MNETTKITDTKLAASTKAAIKEHFPYAVTLGDLKQCISDDPKALDCFTPRTIATIMNILDFNDYDSPAVKQDTPTDTAAFDYSAVDDDTADFLRKATERIARNVLTIMSSQAEIGAILIEAHNRLANHYHGGFEKWYTSLGMSKSSVNRLIQVHEFRENLLRSSQLGQLTDNPLDLFDNLPKTLQADISSPSAPAEAVNAVLSGDITTHKDFVAMKKQLEEVQAENEQLTEKNRFLSMDYTHEKERNERMLDELKEFRKKSDALEVELKQAQSEAREVIMTDPKESQEYQKLVREKRELEEKLHKAWGDLNTEEFDRRIAEISQKFSNDAVRQIAADRQASAELLRDRTEAMQARIDELTDKLKELEGRPITGYFLPASIEDYSGICGLLKGTKYEKIMYAAKLIKM